MSAINTALPRMRAATATEIEESGEIPVPSSINTRTNATICRATKKKIVGGSNAKNSSLSLVDSLDIEPALRWVVLLASSQTSGFSWIERGNAFGDRDKSAEPSNVTFAAYIACI